MQGWRGGQDGHTADGRWGGVPAAAQSAFSPDQALKVKNTSGGFGHWWRHRQQLVRVEHKRFGVRGRLLQPLSQTSPLFPFRARVTETADHPKRPPGVGVGVGGAA